MTFEAGGALITAGRLPALDSSAVVIREGEGWASLVPVPPQSLLTEMENDSRTLQDQDLTATSVVLLLIAFFREVMESLFILADVTATQADIEAQQVIPDTPRLIMLGHWMLSIEGKVVLSDNSDNFIPGFAVLFASYYIFNIEYQESAACTLELAQRQGVRKKTKRVVQRKVTTINPHVNSFIRSLMEFEWKT
ncbi:unnamed protein product [Leuciscus chuanchicus]